MDIQQIIDDDYEAYIEKGLYCIDIETLAKNNCINILKNTEYDDWDTAFKVACQYNHRELVEFLECIPDIDFDNGVRGACLGGYWDLFAKYVIYLEDDLSMFLEYAMKGGNMKIINYILDNSDISIHNRATSVFESGNIEFIHMMINKFDPNVNFIVEYCVKYNQEELLNKYLPNCENVDYALVLCGYNTNLDVFNIISEKYLKTHDMEEYTKRCHCTFMYAVSIGNIDLIKHLLPNITINELIYLYCVGSNSIDVIELIINKQQPDKKILNKMFTRVSSLELFHYFIELGADDINGLFLIACYEDYYKIIKYLLNNYNIPKRIRSEGKENALMLCEFSRSYWLIHIYDLDHVEKEEFLDACRNSDFDIVMKYIYDIEADVVCEGLKEAVANNHQHLILHILESNRVSWFEALGEVVTMDDDIIKLAVHLYNEHIQEIFKLGCEGGSIFLVRECIRYKEIDLDKGIEMAQENGHNELVNWLNLIKEIKMSYKLDRDY